MINTQRHQELLNRLSSEVKYNPSLAARLEESNGYVCDTRENHEAVGEPYEGNTNDNSPF